MKEIRVHASRASTARAEELDALLGNSATYPLWSMIRYYECLRPGDAGPNDVGAIRLFRTNAITIMREEITVRIRNECLGYRLLSGFPLVNYRSLTTLEESPSGTRITWESSFCAKYHGTGWYWRNLMTWVLKRLVNSLAQAAEDPERRARILALADGRTVLSKSAWRSHRGAPAQNELVRPIR